MTAPSSCRIEVHPLLRQAAPEFLARTRTRVTEMTGALASGDFGRVAWIAHQLAGTGLSFGVPYVSEMGRAIERAATSEDREPLPVLLQSLADYLGRIELV